MPVGVSLDDTLVISIASFGTMIRFEFRGYFAVGIPIAAELLFARLVKDARILSVGL